MMTREEHRRLLERLKDPQMTDEERSETDAILWEEMMKPEAVPFLAQEMRLMPEVFPTLAAHPIQTWTDVPKATLTKLQWELKVYLLHARTLEVWGTVEEIDPQEAWERLRAMSLRHPWSDPLTEAELDPLLRQENLTRRLEMCRTEHLWTEAQEIESELPSITKQMSPPRAANVPSLHETSQPSG